MSAVRLSADLARQMLAYAGRAPFVVKPLDLGALVTENAELLRTTVARSISLELRLAPQLPHVRADAAQVQQLVMNLITNAAEAIGDAPGVITLTTGVVELDSAALARTRLGDAPPAGRYVFLEVSGHGRGDGRGDAAPAVRAVLHAPSSTGAGWAWPSPTASSAATTAPCSSTARRARARRCGRSFPRVTRCGAPRGVGLRWRPGPSQLGALRGTVLLVDDEDLVRSVVQQLLEHFGLTVIAGRDGEEGVELFRRHADQVACVLLDLSMPRMDGLAALREMARIRPGVKAILASGYARQDALRRFGGQGLAAFIQKPYGADELNATLRAVLAASG